MFEISDDDSSVFVQLSANGLIRNLALPANEERALVVGSTAGAAFQLTVAGVAPVQFHIERADGSVWVIPAYRIEDLRLNSAAVHGPTQLEGHDIIEFAGVRLEVTIRDAGAFVASGDSLHDDNRELGASYSIALPGEADTTQLAMDPVTNVTTADGTWPTDDEQRVGHKGDEGGGHATMLQWKLDVPLSSRDELSGSLPAHQSTSRQSDDNDADFTLHGTQIIPPYRPPPQPIQRVSEPRLSTTRTLEPNFVQQRHRAIDRDLSFTPGNAPTAEVVRPARMTGKPPKPRRAGVPSTPATSVTPPPLGRHPLMLLAEDEEPSLHWRATRKDPRTVPKPSALTRLGLLTKARPFLVGCVAGVGSALLAILFLAASRFVARRETEIATPLPSVVAELNSLKPGAIPPAGVSVADLPSSVPTDDVSKTDVSAQPSASAPALRPSARKASASSARLKSLY